MMKALLIGVAMAAWVGLGHATAVVPVQTALAPAPAASAVADATSVAALVHDPAHATRQLGGPPGRDGAPGDAGRCFSTPRAEPFYVSLPGAMRCLLAATSVADNPQGDDSAAPLPGALWLFGSALLVFLGISARRTF